MGRSSIDIYNRLLKFLSHLEASHIRYTLAYTRSDALMVKIAVPMEHWEIEFFADGHIETDVFTSQAVNGGKEAEEEFERFCRENELPL